MFNQFSYEVSCQCGWAYVSDHEEEMFRAQSYHKRECDGTGKRTW